MPQVSVAVTPLRKQALLLEARRARVEWVDDAACPFNMSDEEGEASWNIEQILLSSGSKAPSDIINMALIDGKNCSDTNCDFESLTESSIGEGSILLRRARACATVKSAVDIVYKMYEGLSAIEMEERVAKQLIVQVNSKEAKCLLASSSSDPSMTAKLSTSALSAHPKIMALTQNLSVARKAAEGYEVFIQRLRSPESAEIVQGMKHFVTSLESSIQSKFNEVTPPNASEVPPRGKNLVQGLTHFVLAWESKRNAHNKSSKSSEAGETVPIEYDAISNQYPELCEEVTSSIQIYLDKTTETLRTHVLWIGDSEDEFELQAKIAMETFLFQKFHNFLWQLIVDDESDQEMECKLESLQFITWKHLDIKCLADNTISNLDESKGRDKSEFDRDLALERILPVPSDKWTIPINALRFLDAQWSPTSKLVLIMKAYRGVTNALCSVMPEGELPGADDTLPTLILALLHAKPRKIVSNLAFIQTFARPDLLRGEPGYVLTSLLSALHFLRDLNDASALSISADSFAEGLKRCQSEIARKSASKRTKGPLSSREDNQDYRSKSEIDGNNLDNAGSQVNQQQSNRLIATLKSSDIHSARNLGEEISLEWARKWQLKNTQLSETLTDSKLHLPQISSSSNLPKLEQLPIGFSRSYSYLGVQTEDIRVADIPSLLDEYQELVRFCESLLTTRNAEIVAEHKRKMRELRYHLEIQAAAADLQLLNQSDNWGI